MKRFSAYLVSGLLALGFISRAQGQYALLSNSPAPTAIASSMDLAFGAGLWDSYTWGTINLGTALSTHDFLYLEGSSSATPALITFLASNQASLEAWVSAGGNLYINSATQGQNLNLGFGGVTSTYINTGIASASAGIETAVWDGPNSVASTMTGVNFAHNSISGAGLTSLSVSGSSTTLAYMNYGLGRVTFGGETSPAFWTGSNPTNLRANTLLFASTGGGVIDGPVTAVPEPSTYGLIGAGALAGLGLIKRLRRKSKAV